MRRVHLCMLIYARLLVSRTRPMPGRVPLYLSCEGARRLIRKTVTVQTLFLTACGSSGVGAVTAMSSVMATTNGYALSLLLSRLIFWGSTLFNPCRGRTGQCVGAVCLWALHFLGPIRVETLAPGTTLPTMLGSSTH